MLAYRPTLLAIARGRVGSVADAEDVVQETLTRALERLEDLDCDRVEGWLTTVTINACHDLGRERHRHAKRILYHVKDSLPAPYPDEVVAERDYANSVAAALTRLPDQQRIALELRADDVPVDEIARTLQLSSKAAESLLSRGRSAMRRVATAMGGVVTAHVVSAGRRSAGPAMAVAPAAAALCLCYGFLAAPTPTDVTSTATAPSTASAVVSSTTTNHGQAGAPRTASAHLGVRASASAVRTKQVAVGPVRVDSKGTQRRRPNESVVSSVQDCIRDGVSVSASFVGCADGR